jgi:hypothetical protein
VTGPIEKVQERPAETAAPTVWIALSGLMVAFGIDPQKAAAIAGVAAALTPTVVTFFAARRKRG